MAYDRNFDWSAEGPSRLNRRSIPNITVRDQTGESHRFYADLVEGRTVLIAFTSIAHDAHYPCTDKLAAVRDALDGGRAEAVEILTLTVDPDKDRAAAWSQHATQAGARRGWRFLRGDAEEVEELRGALYSHRGPGVVSGQAGMVRRADLAGLAPEKAVMDCSLGLLRYGNEACDLWGGVPVRADAAAIAQRLEQVYTDPSWCATTARRRGGPMPVTTS